MRPLRRLVFLVAAIYPTFTYGDDPAKWVGDGMSRWRPGRAWFAEHCSRLTAIATAVDDDPRLRALWAASFG